MTKLPKKALAKTRTFKEDNVWLVKEAQNRHTVVAVIINELISNEKESRERLRTNFVPFA